MKEGNVENSGWLKVVMGEVGATFKMDIMRDKAQESVLLLFYFFILAG